jgi:outer membrane protein
MDMKVVMSHHRSCFFFICFLIGLTSNLTANAQEKWSLQKCVEYAAANNLQVKQSILTQQTSEVNLLQYKLGLLPNLSGTAQQGFSFGRNIDPYTNTYVVSNINYSNFALNSNLVLFNGFSKIDQIKQSQFDLAANQKATQQMIDNISLNVANAFLQVVLDKEQLSVAQDQVDLSKESVDHTQKLVEGGALAEGSLFDVQAQLAKDQQSLVTAENNLALAILNLQQLLNLDKPVDTDVPSLDVTAEMLIINTDSGKLYQSALTTQPEIAEGQFKVNSSEKALSVSRGAYYPTLSAFASVSTNFSSIAQNLVYGTPTFEPIGIVEGTDEIVETPVSTYTLQNIPFNTQIDNNLGKIVGLQLNVPIFSGLQNRSNVERSRINLQNEQLNFAITKQQLQKDVETAYTNAVGASKSYVASMQSEESLKKAFDYATAKLNAGLITGTDYDTAKNNYEAAESTLLQSKYQLIFNLKVLDFYQGKPLTL